MSGIYIPNQKMPDCCDTCFYTECQRFFTSKGRPEDCPIGFVPAHGRLGDLDELKERVTRRLYASNHGSMAEAYFAALIDLLDTAPTIIEAEVEK